MATRKAPKDTAKRSAALSIRVDEKTKYGLELLSRIQRRSVTGVVEWAVAQAFSNCTLEMDTGGKSSLDNALNAMWSVNELERVILLAEHAYWLLTYDEERMVEVLRRTKALWGDHRLSHKVFDFSEVLPAWEKLRPIVMEAAERPVIVGLTKDELRQAGIDPPCLSAHHFRSD
ncbi:hypothetical protein HKX42_10290 [Salinisphaera sp. USBA-960]|nr:hypothetical protein [Salifodinibacter halophilus]NNC27262.1 hypothetical protein [Salifodinibacter halophilus]